MLSNQEISKILKIQTMRLSLWLLLLLTIFSSCKYNRPKNDHLHFEIQQLNQIYRLKIHYNGENFTYYFSKHPNNDSIIKIPITKIAVTSTTHIGFINFLDEINTIVAVSGKQYVYNQQLRARFNKIKELGFDKNLNIEQILLSKPQILTVYNLAALNKQKIKLLKQNHIIVLPILEYTETTPLARLEWIKVFGLLYDKLPQATAYTDSVRKNYLSLTSKIKTYIKTHKLHRTKVLTNIPYKGIWYVPAGNSYMAKFIIDAGGNYPWANTKSTLSLPLSFEQVMVKAADADVLINTGLANSIDQIISIDKRLKNFRAVRNRNVYNNNKLATPYGGTAFWELGPAQPDRILSDLIRIFYPKNNFTPDTLTFYKKLN